jgi:cytochrome bd-type quinol oxidase subunit 1
MDFHTFKVVIGISLPFFILTVWAIVNVLQKDFGSVGKKAMWGIIAAIPFIGAPIYLILGFRKGKRVY